MIVLGGFLMIVFVIGFLFLVFFGEFEAGRLQRKKMKEETRKRTGGDDPAGMK
jgi:hypothetical protein